METDKDDEKPANESNDFDADMQIETSADIVWLNVLMGRILYSCLADTKTVIFLTNLLQRKLNAIKMPPFMENVSIANVNLGKAVPKLSNIVPPLCDERGLWLEGDISYDGLITMTISTKLNLMRLRKIEHSSDLKRNFSKEQSFDNDNNVRDSKAYDIVSTPDSDNEDIGDKTPKKDVGKTKASIYDSDAESSGESSTDSEVVNQSFIDKHRKTE